jgi:predicted RNase H-like nuclease (RuvC/YqgF family)
MSDHYHHAGEVSGAAREDHGHSPREIGAAEDHDVTMLERRVQSLESEVGNLTHWLQRAQREIAALRAHTGTEY